MTSDLVEAHTFSRRRLTTAFVSGATGAWHDAERRALRTVVGGLALAVLVVAGAVIARVLAPRPPDDWTSPGLVVSEDTGQAFVILPNEDHAPLAGDERVELHPVANLTSARLVLGSTVEPVVVPQDAIDGQRIGSEIGIRGAPATLPERHGLISSGWSACTADGRGTHVRLAAQPDVRPAPDAALVVTVGHTSYVVASTPAGGDPPAAYALALPRGSAVDNMLGSLGLPPRALAPRVPRDWLRLFPAGRSLGWRSFGIDRAQHRPTPWDRAGVPRGARVGDVVEDLAGNAVVMTVEGPADLDPFALAVYTWTTIPGRGAPRVFSVDRLPDLARTRLPIADAPWPSALPRAITTDPCAVLVAAPGAPAQVQLAEDPGDGHAVGDVDPGHAEVTVDPGRGAYVLAAGSARREARPVVIDSGGRVDPLDGDDTAAQLGYADHPAPEVPPAWLALFDDGVRLSRALALCATAPVGARSGQVCG